MKRRYVPFPSQLVCVALCSVMIGLFIEDRDAQMLALLCVLLASALVVGWIEARWERSSHR